jgi:hypothetical protein
VLVRGTAFLLKDHLWFVLSDPSHSSGKVLCVNLTTPGGFCEDDECFLTTEDYSWIKHRSVVAFSFAKIGDTEKLDEAINTGALCQPKQCVLPISTIEKVVLAGNRSIQLNDEVRELL